MAWAQDKAKHRIGALSFKRLPAGFSSWSLFGFSFALCVLGILMIYSSSAVLGMQKFGDGLYFVKRQALPLLVGWLAYFVIAQMPVLRFSRMRVPAYFLSLLLLVLVLIPGVGVSAGGAQRWINLGFFQFQPSEVVRLLLVLYLAGTLALRRDRLNSFNKGFLPLLVVSSSLMLCLILQPDFGGAMGILLLSVALWFVGGVPFSYLAGLSVLAIPAVVFVLFQADYRTQRVMTFLNPWKDPQGSGFQVIQSFTAFYDGGWSGVGLGNSQQKLFYLPEAHTDFIFSVIGEELGVIGVLFVVSLFVGILISGSRIARKQASLVGYLLSIGLTLFICVPALFNMMVTLGLLPTKGLPLPLVSFGRSSLIASLVALGALQSLNRRCDEDLG